MPFDKWILIHPFQFEALYYLTSVFLVGLDSDRGSALSMTMVTTTMIPTHTHTQITFTYNFSSFANCHTLIIPTVNIFSPCFDHIMTE